METEGGRDEKRKRWREREGRRKRGRRNEGGRYRGGKKSKEKPPSSILLTTRSLFFFSIKVTLALTNYNFHSR